MTSSDCWERRIAKIKGRKRPLFFFKKINKKAQLHAPQHFFFKGPKEFKLPKKKAVTHQKHLIYWENPHKINNIIQPNRNGFSRNTYPCQ